MKKMSIVFTTFTYDRMVFGLNFPNIDDISDTFAPCQNS